MSKETKNNKKTWLQYLIIGVLVFGLYLTGLHTEVIGFLQRGLLATGLMNPSVEKIQETARNRETSPIADLHFQLMDKQGNSVLVEDFEGKVIFLNFWATWCPPCVAEMPNIKKMHDELSNQIVLILISVDDDFETAKAFDERKGYNLPIYTLQSSLPAMFKSKTIPTTYVIDASGRLILTHEGMANYNDKKFKEFLKNLK